MEQLVIDISSSIRSRERYLKRLRVTVEQQTGTTSSEVSLAWCIKIEDVFLLVRTVTISITASIVQWRKLQGNKPVPFLFKGENYLLLICRDTLFLNKHAHLFQDYFKTLVFDRNPLFGNDTLDDIIRHRVGQQRQVPVSLTTATTRKSKSSRDTIVEDKRNIQRGGRKMLPSSSSSSTLQDINPILTLAMEEATDVLIREEGLFGCLRRGRDSIHSKKTVLGPVLPMVERTSSTHDELGDSMGIRNSTIYDECQELQTTLRKLEKRIDRATSCLNTSKTALERIELEILWVRYCDRKDSSSSFRKYVEPIRCECLNRADDRRELVQALINMEETALVSQKELLQSTVRRLDRLDRERKSIQQDYRSRKNSAQEDELVQFRVAEKEKKIQYERARKAARGQSNRAETKRKKKEMEKEEKRVNDAKMIKLQREARLLRTSTPELSSSELRKRQTLRDKMEHDNHIYQLECARENKEVERNVFKKELKNTIRVQNERRHEAAQMLSQDNASHRANEVWRRQYTEIVGKIRWETQKLLPLFTSVHRLKKTNQLYRVSIYRTMAHGYTPDGYSITFSNTHHLNQLYCHEISDRELDRLGYTPHATDFHRYCDDLQLQYDKVSRGDVLRFIGKSVALPLRTQLTGSGSILRVLKKGIKVNGSFHVIQLSARHRHAHCILAALEMKSPYKMEQFRIHLSTVIPKLITMERGGALVVKSHVALVAQPTHRAAPRLVHRSDRDNYSSTKEGDTDELIIDVYDNNVTTIEIVVTEFKSKKQGYVVLHKSKINPYGLDMETCSLWSVVATCVDVNVHSSTIDVVFLHSKWKHFMMRHIQNTTLTSFGVRCNEKGYYVFKVDLIQMRHKFQSNLQISTVHIHHNTTSLLRRQCLQIPTDEIVKHILSI